MSGRAKIFILTRPPLTNPKPLPNENNFIYNHLIILCCPNNYYRICLYFCFLFNNWVRYLPRTFYDHFYCSPFIDYSLLDYISSLQEIENVYLIGNSGFTQHFLYLIHVYL